MRATAIPRPSSITRFVAVVLADAFAQRFVFAAGHDRFGEVIHVGQLGRQAVGLPIVDGAENVRRHAVVFGEVDADLHAGPAILRPSGDQVGHC